ncbi:hypothetical protein NUW54_g12710 [Trametes sanguinea]|uniref:Uncharacterized protein n=1 Tax=Trametes sanguinea TaxID=158606 RepID=A0ACC1MVA2_9APHY|nr:hypothetical protein NUW54_g12710 [Trametes sanguinea]
MPPRRTLGGLCPVALRAPPLWVFCFFAAGRSGELSGSELEWDSELSEGSGEAAFRLEDAAAAPRLGGMVASGLVRASVPDVPPVLQNAGFVRLIRRVDGGVRPAVRVKTCRRTTVVNGRRRDACIGALEA